MRMRMRMRLRTGPPAGSTRGLARRVSADEADLRIMDLLARWAPAALPGLSVSRSRLRAAVVAGAVRIGGRVERRPGRRVREGERVEAALDPTGLAGPLERTDRPFSLSPQSILYRDEQLMVVDKPPGLPTHATADPARPHLVAHVRERLAAEGREPYLAVHQRLDRDTSGVVLFAIDRAANAALARAFAAGEVEKTYLALAVGGRRRLPDRFLISVPLAVSRTDGAGRVVAGGLDALPAETEVVLRERLPGAVLVEARPRTGRKHQVRAHLAHVGLPLLGDRTYGDRTRRDWTSGSLAAPRTMLHAWRLALPHPTSGRPLVIESPLPADFLAALAAARRQPERRGG